MIHQLVSIALIASSASANITGLAANSSFVGAKGEYCQLDVYVTFSVPYDWLYWICCGGESLSGATFADLVHNDSSGGSWAPQATLPNAIDSFLTIGDPIWGPMGFNQQGIPIGAGWFNSSPPSLQGIGHLVSLFDTNGAPTYTGLASLAARFVVPTELAYRASLTLDTQLQWGFGISQVYFVDPPAMTFAFATVPGPASALAIAFSFFVASSRERGRRRVTRTR